MGSQTTIPIVCVISTLLWLFLPQPDAQFAAQFATGEYGLWQFVPATWQSGLGSLSVSFALAALCVYLLMELNNANALLRITSRMLGAMLALLLAFSIPSHSFQPSSIVALCVVLSFFPQFAGYQLPSPTLSFTSYLLLSVASLVFPKFLCVVPVYWLMQLRLRSFSFRCFLASLLAVAIPYWFYVGIAFLLGDINLVVSHFASLADFHWGDYAHLPLSVILLFSFFVILFVIGTVNFFYHSFLDKTRTRELYRAVIIHGVCFVCFILFQPQYTLTLMPVLILDASILFGHFFALTYTRSSHIICLIVFALAIALLAAISL